MHDFLRFRRMVTPLIIEVVFWIGILAIMVISLIDLIGSNSVGVRVLAFFMLILGPLFWRMWCEYVIVFFRMNETLTDIRTNTRQLLGLAAPPPEEPAFGVPGPPAPLPPTPAAPVGVRAVAPDADAAEPPEPTAQAEAPPEAPFQASPPETAIPPKTSAWPVLEPFSFQASPPETAIPPERTEVSGMTEPQALPEKRLCTQCGAPNPTTNRFCESCGSELGA